MFIQYLAIRTITMHVVWKTSPAYSGSCFVVALYAQTFKRFGVRGASLPVLSVDHMTGILRMRDDAARSLRAAIDRMMTSYVTTATVAAAVAGCQSPHAHLQRRLEPTESAIGVS